MECFVTGLGSLHMAIKVDSELVVGVSGRIVHIRQAVVRGWPFLVGLLRDKRLVEVYMSTHFCLVNLWVVKLFWVLLCT